jgi:hypothetical protein
MSEAAACLRVWDRCAGDTVIGDDREYSGLFVLAYVTNRQNFERRSEEVSTSAESIRNLCSKVAIVKCKNGTITSHEDKSEQKMANRSTSTLEVGISSDVRLAFF